MTTEDFLRDLFGHPDLSGMHLAIWDRQTRQTAFFQLPDVAQAAANAKARAETNDVYFGVCPYASRPGDPTSRGSAEIAGALVGLWADIDVYGPAHKSNALPPTREAAFDLIYEMPRRPSVVVSSGYGLQAWWLLDRPALIRTDDDRKQAAATALAWVNLLDSKAKAHGWKMDPVGDLARVLRLPGTRNHKLGTAEPVEVMP